MGLLDALFVTVYTILKEIQSDVEDSSNIGLRSLQIFRTHAYYLSSTFCHAYRAHFCVPSPNYKTTLE
jgi:hypothetical protein